MYLSKEFPIRDMVGTKALRHQGSWYVSGLARRPVRLEQNKQRERERVGEHSCKIIYFIALKQEP